MKQQHCLVGMLVFMSAGLVTDVQAQRPGAGGVLDWIHKLSGPQYGRIGPTFTLGLGRAPSLPQPADFEALDGDYLGTERRSLRRIPEFQGGNRFRVTVLFPVVTKPDTADLKMYTAQFTFEFQVAREVHLPALGRVGTLDAAVGGAAHYFTSDQGSSFWNFSVPIQAILRPLSFKSKGWRGLKVGFGVQLFGRFRANEIQGTMTEIPIGTREWVTQIFFGYDVFFR